MTDRMEYAALPDPDFHFGAPQVFNQIGQRPKSLGVESDRSQKPKTTGTKSHRSHQKPPQATKKLSPEPKTTTCNQKIQKISTQNMPSDSKYKLCMLPQAQPKNMTNGYQWTKSMVNLYLLQAIGTCILYIGDGPAPLHFNSLRKEPGGLAEVRNHEKQCSCGAVSLDSLPPS